VLAKQNGYNFFEELDLFMKNDDDEYGLVKTAQTNITKVVMIDTDEVLETNIAEPVKIANINTFSR
jgi:hypothetical protein